MNQTDGLGLAWRTLGNPTSANFVNGSIRLFTTCPTTLSHRPGSLRGTIVAMWVCCRYDTLRRSADRTARSFISYNEIELEWNLNTEPISTSTMSMAYKHGG